MERNFGNNQFPNNKRGINLDLTLRLGTPVNDTDNLEEDKNVRSDLFHGFYGGGVYQANNESNFSMHGNVEFGGSSSTYVDSQVGAPFMPLTTSMYGPNASNLAFYQGLMPPVPTTPTRKRQYKRDDSRICKTCGVKSTPLWRKGPNGPQTLCNACGLKHSRNVKKDAE